MRNIHYLSYFFSHFFPSSWNRIRTAPSPSSTAPFQHTQVLNGVHTNLKSIETAMTESRRDQATSQPFVAPAPQNVAAWEGGRIINEHYSFEEYVKRRGYFLGQHSDWKDRSSGVFPVARADAHEIYHSEAEQLSVQEVRRRELVADIQPLLPFPTTANTDTLDRFQGYPTNEWDPAMAPANPTSDSSTQHLQAADSPTSSGERAENVPQARIAPGTGSSFPTTKTSETQIANATKNASVAEQTNGVVTISTSATNGELTNSSSSNMNGMSSINPSSPPQLNGANSVSRPADSPPAAQRTDAELVQEILARLGNQPNQPRDTVGFGPATTDRPDSATKSSQAVAVNGNVSSLSNRGISLPVKGKRGKKRPATTPFEGASAPSDETEDDPPAELMQPPVKKAKIDSTAKQPKKRDIAVNKRKPYNKPKKSSGSQSKTNLFEAVIAGTELPLAAGDARAGADARYKCLLSEHKETANASKQSRAERARKAATDPDMLPEFFNVENFPKGQGNDSVRCVCGAVADDGQEMIACDECNVWQHNACMGDAVPEDTESETYQCHVCDPWAHRELIAGLRRDHPLEG